MSLPAPLRSALNDLTEGLKLGALAGRHDAISRLYRSGGPSSGAIDSEAAVAAYALARMPATYAACRAALAELVTALPNFSPASAADFGCGPGTALFAASEAFPALRRLAGFDHNPRFLRFAGRLCDSMRLGTGREVFFQSADLADGVPDDRADLVLASYALVEMTEAAASVLVRKLWAQSAAALVLVEPGSQAGFMRLRMARAALIAEGATILAPCTHHNACPMPVGDWCHFSVRLARSRAHQRVKAASVPFEDEKFSYLIAARQGFPAYAARIIAPVVHGKAGHRLPLCDASGCHERIVGTRDANFKAAKKWDWGDGIL